MQEHAWAEISLGNLRHNYRALKRAGGGKRGIIGVVKSDAYGHGMVPVARELRKCGASFLAVAELHEALTLKAARVGGPVMILSRTMPANLSFMVKSGFIQIVGSLFEARQISAAAIKHKKRVRIHINADTGMNRLGVPENDQVKTIKSIASLPGIRAEGLMTHLFESEKPSTGNLRKQIKFFQRLIALCTEFGIRFKYIHCANSGGIINAAVPETNLIRPGISMYGYHPGIRRSGVIDLKPLLTLKARIVGFRSLARGEGIGYNAAWKAPRKSRVAVLSVGYGDGYPRAFKNLGTVLVRGKACPVVGTVCMNHTFIDVSRVPGLRTGDTAVLYGRQGKNIIFGEDAAAVIGTISYELTCRLTGLAKKYLP